MNFRLSALALGATLLVDAPVLVLAIGRRGVQIRLKALTVPCSTSTSTLSILCPSPRRGGVA